MSSRNESFLVVRSSRFYRAVREVIPQERERENAVCQELRLCLREIRESPVARWQLEGLPAQRCVSAFFVC